MLQTERLNLLSTLICTSVPYNACHTRLEASSPLPAWGGEIVQAGVPVNCGARHLLVSQIQSYHTCEIGRRWPSENHPSGPIPAQSRRPISPCSHTEFGVYFNIISAGRERCKDSAVPVVRSLLSTKSPSGTKWSERNPNSLIGCPSKLESSVKLKSGIRSFG